MWSSQKQPEYRLSLKNFFINMVANVMEVRLLIVTLEKNKDWALAIIPN